MPRRPGDGYMTGTGRNHTHMGTNPRTRAKKATRAKPRRAPARGARTSQGAASTAGTARSARSDRDKMPTVGEEMWALTYDVKTDKWDKSKGFRKELVLKPQLDEAADPLDASMVIAAASARRRRNPGPRSSTDPA